MWSELFKHDMPNGEKIAIALMDTQGVFDSKSTVKECSTVFALSTMLSSVLIFNVSQNIQEDDLQHLLFFTEYGKLALAESEEKPFQRLQFLVRDWHFVKEAEYGAKGGQKILNNRLEIQEGQHHELRFLREHLSSCFEDISCFLMPYPGSKIFREFDGRLSLLEPEFRTALKDLVPMLLAPENLVIKQIHGQTVKARDFVRLFSLYNQVFMGDTLPEPKTLLAATAEASNLAAFEAAKEIYIHEIEEFSTNNCHLNASEFKEAHENIKERAIHEFESKHKMGGEALVQSYHQKLKNELERIFTNLKTSNDKFNLNEIKASKMYYKQNIDEICQVNSLDLAMLEEEHARIKNEAMEQFNSKRKIGDCENLEEQLDEIFTTMKISIEANDKIAYEDAKEFYKNKINKICEVKHIDSALLETENLRIKTEAMEQFKTKCKFANCGQLEKDLQEIFDNLKRKNTLNDLEAFNAAKKYYMEKMELIHQGSQYIEPVFSEKEHLRIKSQAIEQFNMNRKMGDYTKLDIELDTAFNIFKMKNETKKPREVPRAEPNRDSNANAIGEFFGGVLSGVLNPLSGITGLFKHRRK
uniref:CSON008975 protein n=1 Tax=Culicoides sonorensis TaxID=179676 RepID=A0A336M3B6_CULSO